jgi:hypothetical protein
MVILQIKCQFYFIGDLDFGISAKTLLYNALEAQAAERKFEF